MDKEMIEHTAAKPLGLFDRYVETSMALESAIKGSNIHCRPGFGSVSFRNLRVVTMFATQSIDIDSNESGVGEHTGMCIRKMCCMQYSTISSRMGIIYKL